MLCFMFSYSLLQAAEASKINCSVTCLVQDLLCLRWQFWQHSKKSASDSSRR